MSLTIQRVRRGKAHSRRYLIARAVARAAWFLLVVAGIVAGIVAYGFAIAAWLVG